jgi:dTDP-4-dehydrorhamnose 3,5-epimerase
LPFKFLKTELEGVFIIETQVFKDKRGFLFEAYKESDFFQKGLNKKFVQDNISYSIKNVLRGIHYQIKPGVQGKLVRCLKGKIFDVAVDLRKNSESFGKWIGFILSEENQRMLYIPEGFGHGFCVLSDYAIVFYKLTHEYSSELERGIRWDDPDINIKWPIENPILSERDKNLPYLKEAELSF